MKKDPGKCDRAFHSDRRGHWLCQQETRLAVHYSRWTWPYRYFEIRCCPCVYFFCFHYRRLNIVPKALKRWPLTSGGNSASEMPRVSNCREEGNNFLILLTVLYFQGQSDKTSVAFHLYFLKWTMIETFIYNTFFRGDLADNRVSKDWCSE